MKKLLFLLVCVSIFAQEATHEVKKGDTLWDIAAFYYQNPFLWPYIWRANLTQIADPHWIYPEQVFVIPPSPEQGLAAAPAAEVPEYVPAAVPPPPKKPGAELITLIAPEEKIFTEEIVHRAGLILDDDPPLWGTVVGTEPADAGLITAYKIIYIDRATDIKEGDWLTIYRPGHVLTDPKTGKKLGKAIIFLGKAEVKAIGKEGSRCKVYASYDIIKRGDLVTPLEPIVVPENVELISASEPLEGYVVEVKPAQMLTPPHVFVYIDQGEEAGIAIGDVFDVYQKRVVAGKEMPDFTIGRIQVISVFRNASIGLLLQKREPINVERGEHIRLTQEAR